MMCSPLLAVIYSSIPLATRRHFGYADGPNPDVVFKLNKTVPAFTAKSQEWQVKLSQASSQTIRELITDERLESKARSLLKKPDFLFGDSIDEDVEVMLDGVTNGSVGLRSVVSFS